MSNLGTHVVAPVMLVSGMVIGIKTMDRVARAPGSGSRARRRTAKRRKKSKSQKKPKSSYYCRKCKTYHRKKSKIGKAHKR